MLTACTKDCPDCCSIIVAEKQNGYIIMGNPEHPVTKGFTCAKIKKHIDRLKSPSRITTPLLKKGNEFKEISWDQALEICAEKLKPLLKKDPRKILHIQGDGARGVSKVATDNFFTRLGCTKTIGSLCDITGIQACIEDFGLLDHNNINDLLNASHIVNFGKDFSSSSIHLSQIIKQARKNNIHVTSIWPGSGDYDQYADKLIRINPGTDRFLALAIVKCLIDNNDVDKQQVEKCINQEKYFNLIKGYSLTYLSKQCGVTINDIKFLASIYSKKKVSTIIGWGLQRYSRGMENVRHINALAWISNNVGYAGAGVYFSISSLRNFNLEWADAKPCRSVIIPILAKEIEQCSPKIEAAFINCSNVVNQAPDSRRIFQALKNINFTIVVDAFMTDTAISADLILPSTLMWEEEEIVGSFMHDYLQYANQVFLAPEGCKSDFQIVKELNQKLDTKLVLQDMEDYFRLSFPESSTNTSYETFIKIGFAFAGKTEPAFAKGTEHESGQFALVSTLTKEPEHDPVFPMHLLSLINKNYIHSQILPEEQESLPIVIVSPDIRHTVKINLKGKIFLATCIGRLEVEIQFDNSLHPDTIVYRKGDWMKYKGGVNSIIEAKLTDSGTGAAYYAQHARLEN